LPESAGQEAATVLSRRALQDPGEREASGETMSRLPPLSAIRAFEASARHLNFTKAAEELFVTQSAISRHIRNLEDLLGAELFVRGPRGLALTPAGEQYHYEIAGLFRKLTVATDRVRRTVSGRERLNVHSFTTFAMNWLIPRLRGFQKAHPHIDILLTASNTTAGVDLEQAHAVISVGPGPFERSIRLFPVSLIPVCTPEYCRECLPDRSVESLVDATLLHATAAENNWELWLQRCGGPDLDLGAGLRFDSSAMAYVAATRNMGVAMGNYQFVRNELERGILMAPMPTLLVKSRSFYLSLTTQESPALRHFQDWVQSEVEADNVFPAELSGLPLTVLRED